MLKNMKITVKKEMKIEKEKEVMDLRDKRPLPIGISDFKTVIEENYYYFDIRSDNEKCGGDPSVAPRLFSYQVNKKTGELKTDSMDWAEKVGKDPLTMEFHAID